MSSHSNKGNNVLVLGAGGVGEVVSRGLQRIPAVTGIIIADIDGDRARQVAEKLNDPRARSMSLNAGDTASVANALRECRIAVHAGIPRFNLSVMEACLQAGANYVDMASDGPLDLPGVVTIQKQLTYDARFREAGLLAVLGIGSDPGVTNVMARYAYDRMNTVEEIIIYDGDNVEIEDYDFAVTFSPETSIEECLQPPLTYADGKYSTGVPLETGVDAFTFPDPIGKQTVRCVSHEEVGTIPLFLNGKGLKRCEFKYGLGESYIEVLKVLQAVGLDSDEEIQVGGVTIVPRKVVASLLPHPFDLKENMTGSSCMGTWVKGTDLHDNPLEMFLYTMLDHSVTQQDMGANVTVFQAGIPAVIAVHMMLDGTLTRTGAVSPEQLDPQPWITRLPAWGMPLYVRKTTSEPLAEERLVQV